ncbi:ribulose-phosphate 3-epimerase [Helicobacter enhydrae]|uniref:Ribulose-phosphate 3-epimerase n=1 Tax=Helicobacter enhydrae TaxID=222136 RepID=A0A1B1U6Z7_9HELI|nr:ribulose-phosphate 3-epimerase [Helicobacter enhydrae]ANV98538.1 ribulose-phosphate 3-epimerase [Helicobacter enhydrae]
MKIAPSILSANFLKLEEEVSRINVSGADFLHIDVMDGHFVPNLTFGPAIVEQIKQVSTLPLDIHLMVENISFFVDLFALLTPRFLSFHIEEEKHIHRIVQKIRDYGISPAVVVNPHTPLELLKYILPDVDMVLLMSVNPGFGGQKFIPATLDKVRQLREMIDDASLRCLIEVDGGVSDLNARELFDVGADILVAGSYIFGSTDYQEAVCKMRKS